jgi:hypothetical protein
VYELPPDADDEAMMELAIALSLQEQGEEAALGLHHLLGEAIENGGPVDEGEGSSSSASGKGQGRPPVMLESGKEAIVFLMCILSRSCE